MSNFWTKLKKRWGVTSSLQVLLIILVFALTGYTTVFAQRYLKTWIGVSHESGRLINFFVGLFLVLPLYTLILLIWAYILGQKDFFLRFVKAKIRLLSGGMRK